LSRPQTYFRGRWRRGFLEYEMRMIPRLSSSATLAVALTAALATGLSACKKEGAASTNPGDSEDGEGGQPAAASQSSAKAATLVSLANDELGRGRFNAARTRAEEALKSNPSNVDAHAVLGLARLRGGDYQGALEALKAGAALDATNFGVSYALTRTLQMSGRHDEALEAVEKLIAAESNGWVEGPCDASSQCETGVCDPTTNTCKPQGQISPRALKFHTLVLRGETEKALKVADEIFVGIGGNEAEVAVVRRLAGFMRPFAGKGPLLQVEGDMGEASYKFSQDTVSRLVDISVAGKRAIARLDEGVEEVRISPEFGAKLGLASLGKGKIVDGGEDLDIVLIPEIKIGELAIKNVPALVQDSGLMDGEIQIGGQVLHKLGSYTLDPIAGKMSAYAQPLSAAPEGTHPADLLMVNMLSVRIPAIRVSLDDSSNSFWVYMGGGPGSMISLSKREYLRAGHRPEDLAPLDDVEQGMKMVLIKKLAIGEHVIEGVGGVALCNNPPDGTLPALSSAGLGIEGYLNAPALGNLVVSYDLAHGKVYLK
jgi:tetratricopeptide (TPR) repeat protein